MHSFPFRPRSGGIWSAPLPCLLLLCAPACTGLIDGNYPSDGADGGINIGDPSDDGDDGDDEQTATRCVHGTEGQPLNLRAGPGTDYQVIASVGEGQQISVTGIRGGDGDQWLEVRHGAMNAWALGDYLEECGGDEAPVDGSQFLLPWEGGKTHTVSNGHNSGPAHFGAEYWAWDFSMPVGTPLVATHDGVIRQTKFDSNSGGCGGGYANLANYVVLTRDDGLESLYLHLSYAAPGQEPVHVGQEVQRGTVIGYSGATGWVCGAHLHFQVQSGPGAGGSASYYNQSVQGFFWDTGEAWDPPYGANPLSANYAP